MPRLPQGTTPSGDGSAAEYHVRQCPTSVAKVQRRTCAAAVALGALTLTSGATAAIDAVTIGATDINAGRLAITLTGHGGFKLDTCTNDNSSYHDSDNSGSNGGDSSNNSNTIDVNDSSLGNINNDNTDYSVSDTTTYDFVDTTYGDVSTNNYDHVVNYGEGIVDDMVHNPVIVDDNGPNGDMDNNFVNYFIDENMNNVTIDSNWTPGVISQTNNSNANTFGNDDLSVPEVYYQQEPPNVDFRYPNGSMIDSESELRNPFPSANYPENNDYFLSRPFDTYIFTNENGELVFDKDSVANYGNVFARSEILSRSPSWLILKPNSQEQVRPQYPYERPYDSNGIDDDSSSDDD